MKRSPGRRMVSSAADAVKRLFAGHKPVAPARVPDGCVVYAVGDIHGRDDLLQEILDAIREDAQSLSEHATAVFLGDYVDRGPDSRAVIARLIEASDDDTIQWRFLRGNHDQTVLDFLRNPMTGMAWSDYGGRETMESYGVPPPPPWADSETWRVAAADFAAALPLEHLNFFEELEPSCEIGDYFFVHAGVRPGVPLDRQSARDLLWIREPFLNDTTPLPKVVVHGHTVTPQVHADERRIGIDTGAYASGVLTALRLCGEEGAIIQTGAGAGQRFA
jgi:serine/threonine protein phosphatase 1